MEKVYICFDHIEIIEYYDGLVRGIATNGHECFLLVMTQWDIDRRQRVFAVIDLDPSGYTGFADCFKQSTIKSKGEMWDDFEVVYNDVVHSNTKKLRFLTHEPEINEEYLLEDGDHNSRILKFARYDIRNTII